ncbi:ribosomal protein S18 acetylase RimI-like enzyme [Scopulibacillus darangshiensis]|uniref:Ribosomal protein S18 acetylase RimI-like enzyme n=1 Tax=Scopulibacillus darangshiensis TaxID=442528 RepID=A0A4R2P4U2_9BACL|nr:GNAT family N-acetyltransferase [Scopulibacillus darangshiensis]TCP29773.1 ribosomal protein S18 acetylase RimI-like enzyme [Scopulibacillus darangshiensis]
MNVYQVKEDASDHLKQKIAELFMQQISVSDDEESLARTLEAINMTLRTTGSRLVIAEENEEILGIAYLNIGISLRVGGSYLWLNELYVHNGYRNKGIGKKMLLHIIHMAETEGIKAIELETGVNNSVTKHMYNSLGFYEIVSKRYGFSF